MIRPRILLADDHRLVAEGLRSLLLPKFEIIGVVEDGRDLIEAARKLLPDVIVADISMPNLNGLEALRQLRRDNPQVKVVMLTMHEKPEYARRALDEGASGFVLKYSAPEELVTAIHMALEGKTYITPGIAAKVLQEFRRGSKDDAAPQTALTKRQREILQLLAEGCSAKEIGVKLGIATRTVEFHKYQMMQSLALHNTAELVHYALKHGIAPL